MSRLTHGTFEATDGTFNRLAITDIHLDVHVQGGSRGGGAGAAVCVSLFQLDLRLSRGFCASGIDIRRLHGGGRRD